MISPMTIKLLKLEVAPRRTIYLSFYGQEFVFKSLSKKEYKEIVALSSDEMEAHELTCQMALLYPKEYDFSNGLAGIPDFASKEIIKYSVIEDRDDILNALTEHRETVKSLENQCFIAIKSAFPEVTYEMFEEMTWQETLFKVALAEEILNSSQRRLLAAITGNDIDLKLQLEEVKEQEEITEKEKLRLEIVKRIEEEKQINSLYEQGIDPAIYYNIKPLKTKEIVPPILLGGRHWDRDDVVNAICESINKKKKS